MCTVLPFWCRFASQSTSRKSFSWVTIFWKPFIEKCLSALSSETLLKFNRVGGETMIEFMNPLWIQSKPDSAGKNQLSFKTWCELGRSEREGKKEEFLVSFFFCWKSGLHAIETQCAFSPITLSFKTRMLSIRNSTFDLVGKIITVLDRYKSSIIILLLLHVHRIKRL